MLHVLALQIACGAFAAFVAARNGRNRAVWFAIGMLLPVLGVVLALSAKKPYAPGEYTGGATRSLPRRPKRCIGAYTADCLGCRHFSRPLFDDSYKNGKKGRCGLFRRELIEQAQGGSRVVMEE